MISVSNTQLLEWENDFADGEASEDFLICSARRRQANDNRIRIVVVGGNGDGAFRYTWNCDVVPG